MKELLKFANAFGNAHPELQNQIFDLVQLCNDEINEGGSPEHEIQLCEESIRQLLED